MQITVVFAHWHIGDGNYPPFGVGDEGRLSFELSSRWVETVPEREPDGLRQLRDAEYDIVGRVIRQYDADTDSGLTVIDADGFRFYDAGGWTRDFPVGARIRLHGRLELDHFRWVENLDAYPDPPDLFYGVRVVRVREVQIPERFVHRSSKTLSHPSTLSPDDYTAADVRDVAAVSADDGPAFSLLDLELLAPGDGLQRLTFLYADP